MASGLGRIDFAWPAAIMPKAGCKGKLGVAGERVGLVAGERHGKFAALLAVLLAGFAALPLLQSHFIASSDGLFHLYRLMEYDRALRDGVLYPRWAPDFYYGLGMPLFHYYAPLTYYFGEAFTLFGAGYIDALKWMEIVAMGLSGLGAFLYARTLLSPAGSFLAAVMYVYVPYHLVNLFYRGDLAEYLAYTWFPFVLWAMVKLIERGRTAYLCAGGLCYAALILTHNLSALLFSGFLLVYAAAALIRSRNAGTAWTDLAKRAGRLAAMASLGVLLSAFFWLPAIAEKSLVDFDRLLFHYNFHEAFPTVAELLSTDLIHRYGVVFRTADIYGYKLGLLQTVFLVLGPMMLIWQHRRLRQPLRIEALASLVVVALALFLIFPVSTWVWEQAPLLNLTQFPWRLLAFLGLPTALFAGLMGEVLPGRWRWPGAGILATMVVISSTAGISPIVSNLTEADVSPKGSVAFELSYGPIGTSAAAEYLPRTVKQRGSVSPLALSTMLGEPIGPVAGRTTSGVEATPLERRADRAMFRLRADKSGQFVPNVLFFPGWVGSLDGQPLPLAVDDPSGLIKIEVPPGEHTLDLRFEETTLRRVSDLLSVATLFVVLTMGVILLTRHIARVAAASRLGSGRQAKASALFRPSLPTMIAKFARDNLGHIAVVLLLLLAWLGAKSTYEAGNVPQQRHPYSLLMNLENGIQVEGYDLAGVTPDGGEARRIPAGATLGVTVFWRKAGAGDAGSYRPFARLTNSFDQTWAYAEGRETSIAANPTGDGVIASNLDMPVPAGTPPGVYEIELGFQSIEMGRPLTVRQVLLAPTLPDEKGARIGPLIVARGGDIKEDPLSTGAAASTITGPIAFGDNLKLLGVSLRDGEALKTGRPGGPLREVAAGQWGLPAGEAIHLELLWMAAHPLRDDLTITARLASADRALWAVRDSEPADGTYPTSYWTAGETVRDQMNLTIAPETPPGRYELQLEVVARGGPLSVLDRNMVPAGPTLKLGNIVVMPAPRPAELKSLKVQRRMSAPVYGEIALLGYTIGRPALQPGETLKVDIVWGSNQAVSRDLMARLALVDRSGNDLASELSRPVGDDYPTTAWRPGEVLRGQYNLMVPAAAPEGDTDLVVELRDPAGGDSLGKVTLDHVHILPRARVFVDRSPAQPLTKVFDGKVRLLGYDLTTAGSRLDATAATLKAGDTVAVTLHWQAGTEMSTSYTVFAQLLNEAGRLVAQHDGLPQGGGVPTTAWVRDEVVMDDHNILIPNDLSSGDYTLIAGMYDAGTGKRLPVEGGGDYVALGKIRVK